MKKLFIVLLIAILLFAFCGCENGGIGFFKNNQTTSQTTTLETSVTTTAVQIKFVTKEVTLNVGDTNDLAVIAPEEANLKWSSSDPSAVKVDNGKVKGISGGTAIITAQLGESADSCIVKVKSKKAKKSKTTTKKTVKTIVDYTISDSSNYTLGCLSIQYDLGGRSYLDQCTDWKIQEMINEILARNHYKFHKKEWLNYFSEFDWYYYNTSDMSVAESRFSSIERKNYDYLANYRNGN